MDNSTIIGNGALSKGGGIYVISSLTLAGAIVAGNYDKGGEHPVL